MLYRFHKETKRQNKLNLKEIDKMYKCSYCGKEYKTPIDRANCEQKCYEAEQKKIAEAEVAKKNEEKSVEKQKIENLIKTRNELDEKIEKAVGEYCNKYNSYFSTNITPCSFGDIFDRFWRF